MHIVHRVLYINAQFSTVLQSELLSLLSLSRIPVRIRLCLSTRPLPHGLYAAVVLTSMLNLSAMSHFVIIKLKPIISKQFVWMNMNTNQTVNKVRHYFSWVLCGDHAPVLWNAQWHANTIFMAQAYAKKQLQTHYRLMPYVNPLQAYVLVCCICYTPQFLNNALKNCGAFIIRITRAG